MNNENIVFDEKFGISIEEQKDILSHINGIAEKHRLSISKGNISAGSNKTPINAKKNSVFFPLVVNAAAITILVGGSLFLLSFHNKMDMQIRTGNAVYNLTERALIEEIRRDTAEAIAAKETEITSISSRLSEVDDELLALYSSNEELTSEQRATQARLLAMQSAFREELSILHDERTQILESSRTREMHLRAQLDERTREFAAAQQKTTSELDTALKELEKLTNERERILAMEALISSMSSSGENSNAEHLDLLARNTQLQDNIAELQKTIDALSSGGTGLNRRISELQEQINSLEQEQTERESRVSLLETENTGFTSEITRLRSANTAQEQEIANLRNQLTIIRQALQE